MRNSFIECLLIARVLYKGFNNTLVSHYMTFLTRQSSSIQDSGTLSNEFGLGLKIAHDL